MIAVVGSEYSEDEVRNWLSEEPILLDHGVRVGVGSNGPIMLAAIRRTLTFTTAEIQPGSCFFQSPSRFHWDISHEVRQQTKPGDRQVFDHLRQLGVMNLFVQLESKGGWFAAGAAEFKGGQGESQVYCRFSFRVKPKLPRDFWVAVGGYKAWLAAVGRSEREVAVVDDLGPSLTEWGRFDPYLFITRYEDDSLLAAANDRGMAALYYQHGDIGALYRNSEWQNTPSEGISFGGSYDLEVTGASIIRRDQAEALIRQFVTTGDPSLFRVA